MVEIQHMSMKNLAKIIEPLMVIKPLAVSKIVYVFSLLPTPEDVISELNFMLCKFLWNGTKSQGHQLLIIIVKKVD